MNLVNPKKLLQSKWTAVRYDERGDPQTCIPEAIHSQRETELSWRELKNTGQWLMGWQ
jgi:tryptophan-rich hypothetical protein